MENSVHYETDEDEVTEEKHVHRKEETLVADTPGLSLQAQNKENITEGSEIEEPNKVTVETVEEKIGGEEEEAILKEISADEEEIIQINSEKNNEEAKKDETSDEYSSVDEEVQALVKESMEGVSNEHYNVPSSSHAIRFNYFKKREVLKEKTFSLDRKLIKVPAIKVDNHDISSADFEEISEDLNIIESSNEESSESNNDEKNIKVEIATGKVKYGPTTCDIKDDSIIKRRGKTCEPMFQEISVFHNKDFMVKIVVFGEHFVGKTALIKRFVLGKFPDQYNQTLGIENATKQVRWGSSTRIRVQFWDMHGKRDSCDMERACRNAHAVLIVFDSTRQNTLEFGAKMWIQDIKSSLVNNDTIFIPLVLIANKCDLPNSDVNVESLSKFCFLHNLDGWFVTSAKEDIEVDTAMTFTIRAAVQTLMEVDDAKSKGFSLKTPGIEEKNKCF